MANNYTRTLRFPGGLSKALTLSYDDAVVEDIRLIEIMKQHGLKGTFNINSSQYIPAGYEYPTPGYGHRMEKDFVTKLYTEAGIHATIHMDPIVTGDPMVTEVRDKVTVFLKNIDERLSMHDFRMVRGSTHSNLIFDVAVPFEVKTEAAELKAAIDQAIKTIDETYCTVITIDRA
jgi:hypothetical protein